MSDWIFKSLIQPMMEGKPIDTKGAYLATWQTFRVFGNILLVGALLLMVFAQNTGRLMDAYTVKRMAPRVLVGAIAINLSIYLSVAVVDIFDVVGKGINQLLVAPFANGFNPGSHGIPISSGGSAVLGLISAGFLTTLIGVSGILFSVGLLGPAVIAILGTLLPLVVAIVLIALAAFFTVVLRQAIIIFLVIISPVAFALFVLPNTEQYFRKWWDLFFKALLVYPIISVIFAMSNVMAIILMNATTTSGAIMSAAQILTVVVVVYAPIALIPFSFKYAGGLIGTIMNVSQGFANKGAAWAGQRIKAAREDPNTWLGGGRNRLQTGRREHGLTGGQVAKGLRGGLRSRMQGGSFRTGYSASSAVGSRASVYDDATAFMENNAAFKSFSGNDDALWAFRLGTDEASVRRTLEGRGMTDPQALAETTAAIMTAKGQIGSRAAEIAAVRAQAKTGTGWEDQATMLDDIARASGGDMSLAGRTLAEARGSAMQSGRPDLASASFGAQAQIMSRLNDARVNGSSYSSRQANIDAMESAIDSSTAGYLMHGKPQSVRHLAQAHTRRVQTIVNGIQAGTHSQRDLDQELASVMGIHDAMSQASPENARVLADELMNAQITDHNGGSETVYEMANSPYTVQNEAFQQMRRDFSGRAAEAERVARGGVPSEGTAPNPVSVPPGSMPGA